MNDEIRKLFDEMALVRNAEIAHSPIVSYEQVVRSRMVLSMIDAQPEERILDAGCGNARDLIVLKDTGCRCVGVDFSPIMIEQARKELERCGATHAEVEVGTLTDLRFDDASFDKIFSSEVLEHIPEYEQAIAELARVLKPGGTLVITTPNRQGVYGLDRYILEEKLLRRKHQHVYDEWKTYEELATPLAANGLTVTDFRGICYIPGHLVPCRIPRRMAEWLVAGVARAEPWLSRTFPRRGYMIALKARKIPQA